MTLEANAAIEGALAGGATRVLVNDSHWTMRNLLADELHAGAELISGGSKALSMMEGIDAGWDLAAFIGYHAKAGTGNAILDHTYTDRVLDVRLNGVSVGEVGINAALAGAHGVAVALVTGDKAVGLEARALLGDRVRTVAVKEAVSRHAARHLSPETARELIRDSMRDIVEDARRHGMPRARRYVVPAPTTLEVDFFQTVHADHAAMAPGMVRAGPRTVSFQHDDFREVFRAFRTMFNLGGLD
jgi:D-amino peptidase